ncbi:MAG TPA: TIGR01777 family oxidoreductase [Candidatus Didemnitutus sp.]|nr:TIGR01777 family oxidoreductase [Candidatus Didemnitutus sp.]
MPSRIVLAGGSGFLGRSLARLLVARGCEPVILSRTPNSSGSVREMFWDGRTLGSWTAELEGARAVVNLTGRSVNCTPTPENRAEILSSRVDSVQVLTQAMATLKRPPGIWVQTSSLAIYGNPGDRICDESAPWGDDFPARVCRQWEAALPTGPMRVVVLRISLVFGPGGGALGPLVKLVRSFLGGTVGRGTQFVSWIHEDDMNEIFWQAIERSDFSGAYNACTPNPVRNAGLMSSLRRAMHRPWSPPAPSWLVRLGARWFMHTDPDLALTGRRCIPARLQEQGFAFQHPYLDPALDDLVKRGL